MPAFGSTGKTSNRSNGGRAAIRIGRGGKTSCETLKVRASGMRRTEMQGGIEAIYDDVPKPVGMLAFAPVTKARGGMFSARRRIAVARPDADLRANEEPEPAVSESGRWVQQPQQASHLRTDERCGRGAGNVTGASGKLRAKGLSGQSCPHTAGWLRANPAAAVRSPRVTNFNRGVRSVTLMSNMARLSLYTRDSE